MDDYLKTKGQAVLIILLAVLSMQVTTSCSDDDDKVYVYRPAINSYVSMGIADGEGRIHTDKGNILIPDESSVARDLTDGERVFLQCSIVEEENDSTFRVRVNRYFQLLTKGFLFSSETDSDSLGSDPICVERSWFGGGYLNLRLALMHNSSSGVSHRVNLVYDEDASTSDTLRLTLCHNACGDTVHTVKGTAHASFNLKDLPTDRLVSRVYVVLTWRWYDRHGAIVEYSDS